MVNDRPDMRDDVLHYSMICIRTGDNRSYRIYLDNLGERADPIASGRDYSQVCKKFEADLTLAGNKRVEVQNGHIYKKDEVDGPLGRKRDRFPRGEFSMIKGLAELHNKKLGKN